MKKTMKALVSYAPFDSRYEDVKMPEINDDEMLLKVGGCGICAGDIKSYHGGIRIWGKEGVDPYIEAPCIGGHEFYGEIVLKGKNVEEFEIGDKIVSEQIVPCGKCEFCKSGEYWMCKRSAVFGFKQYANGAFGEYIKIPRNCINHKLPNDFTPKQAVLIEPIACGMHALDRANIRPSDTVVISGLGAIGLAIVNMARLKLPNRIVGIDINPNRVKMGKEFGADIVLNAKECNVAKEIMKITNDLGCDVYIEASGSAKSVNQGLMACKNHARFVQMGVFANEVTADWNIIGDGKELNIIGSHLSALTFKSVIKGIESGLIKTKGLISHSYALEDWKEAFDTVENDEKAMKVMLIP